ncbi:putative Methyl-accepting chemotaxis sensory transducer [Desulfamplus magnetovallimortis]|uniref:Putative Methyl-accepting chemotaxis sensory transducer n=1 Tax=Desulfamplus magnetovallimortis TaxID=1246637 RepID=A0A1W1H8T8_9BACT|nr:methyl-accepting chemotaxis protein [Desulfamplus magnetovallimortis]SLM28869.1 putative Methyl-accepting chemotaxis sensory transducer [Desulfamplus magnetovallimortis]
MSFITKKLWLHFMSCISVIVILVFAIFVWNIVKSQNSLHTIQAGQQNMMLADAVEGGMFDALAIGDNDVVKTQFKRLHDNLSGLKVFVYDFNGKISFTTDSGYEHKQIMDIVGIEAGSALKALLENGDSSDSMYNGRFDGEPFTISHKVIPNEKRCFHCHGSSREILGGITVCSSEAESLANMQYSRNISLLIGVVGLIAIIVMIWVLFHYLVNTRLSLVTAISQQMSKGDFTTDIVVTGNNEISTILMGTKKLNAELSSMIRRVIENCNDLNLFSLTLEDVSSTLSTHVTETSGKSQRVASSAEEMSSSLQTIASAMEETTVNVSMMASAAEEMHTTAGEISKSTGQAKFTIEKAAEAFMHTANVVDELGKAASAIDEVTNGIREISEQVGLLALNAKIEAARAGEAGKGFAVVAAEISDLAVETSNSTIKVDETLRWMKQKAHETVTSIQDISKTVEDSRDAITTIASAVEEQAITTQEISGNITQISTGVSDVNQTVNQGAATAKEVAADITVISSAASQIRIDGETVSEKSVQLKKMAEELAGMMSSFKV